MMKHRLDRLPLARRDKAGPSSRIGSFDIVIFFILLIFAILIIFPFYYLFIVSITPQEIYANNPFLLWTPEVTFEAYHGVFTNKAIWNGLGITLILLFGGTTYQLFFTVITGYALSRQNWFGKNFVMNMILVTMFFGGGLIPYYILIMPCSYSVYAVVLMPMCSAKAEADLKPAAFRISWRFLPT